MNIRFYRNTENKKEAEVTYKQQVLKVTDESTINLLIDLATKNGNGLLYCPDTIISIDLANKITIETKS